MKISDSIFLRSIWLALMLVVAVPPAAAAAGRLDELNVGPKVGAALPHSLNVRDHNNRYQEFKSLARRRGLIVLFSRSLDW